MGQRGRESTEACVCCAGYRARETGATCRPHKTRAYLRIGGMHHDRSAPQRARATCSYLVDRYTRVRSRRTDWLCAKIWLVTVDIPVEGHVKERRIVPIL